MTGKSIPERFSELVDHLPRLFRKEVQLAKAEAAEKVQQATGAIAYMAIGGVVLLAALIMLLHAIVAWLVVLGIDVQWGSLIVALVVGIVGYVLLQKGMSDIKASNLKPTRTVEQLRTDARATREQFR
jgi:apolipoprotein N-acyltransferase